MPSLYSQTAKQFFINGIITVCSLTAVLLMAEWIVRVYFPTPNYGGGIRPAFYSNLFEYDDLLGWRGVPNLKTPYFSKDFRIHVSHDPHGYRNISPPFIAGKSNYLLLGDSYAWGWGVEDNETAAAVFNEQHPHKNLYSLGIAGYGTDQELLALHKQLAAQPGHDYRGVILLFYMNDFDDIAAAERYGYPKPRYIYADNSSPTLTNIPVPRKKIPQDIPVTEKPTPETWEQNIQLYNLFERTIAEVIFKPETQYSDASQKVITADEQHTIKLANSLIQEINKVCAHKRMFFHVVFLMTQDTQEHNAVLLHALADSLSANNIKHSFFYSRKFPRTDLWLDAHYTPYGQKLLARHIADVVSNNETP